MSYLCVLVPPMVGDCFCKWDTRVIKSSVRVSRHPGIRPACVNRQGPGELQMPARLLGLWAKARWVPGTSRVVVGLPWCPHTAAQGGLWGIPSREPGPGGWTL